MAGWLTVCGPISFVRASGVPQQQPATASSLKWRARGEVRRASPPATDRVAPSRPTDDPLRDAIRLVNNEQDPAAAQHDAPQPGADPLDAYRDPFDTSSDQPPRHRDDASDAPLSTRPLDELYRDDPIPTPPDRPFELPLDERRQLLDSPGTDPGAPGCEGQREACIRALDELQKRDITTITVGLLIEGVEGTDFPCDCLIGREIDAPPFAGRNFAPTLFTWKASGTCHKPLYFEDVQLERYGHSWNPIVQPFMSGAHFFASVPLLPYKMGLNPPNECIYTLGYYRPGNCAPYMFEPIPLSLRGAVWQGFGATAFAFWFWPP